MAKIFPQNPNVTVAEHFRWYYEKGYITVRDGNAAYRTDKGWTVTTSGSEKNDLRRGDFITVNASSEIVGENVFERHPSIETQAHIDAQIITNKKFSVHVHSPNTVALFAMFDPTATIGERLVEALNSKWPELFRYTTVGKTVPFLEPGSKELHQALRDSFCQDPDIVIMQNHGVLVVGDSFEQCQEHIVRLEHVARILLKILSASGGKTNLIL